MAPLGLDSIVKVFILRRGSVWYYVDYQVATANSGVELDCQREKEQVLLLLTKYLVFFMFEGDSRLLYFSLLDNKERIEKILERGCKEIPKISFFQKRSCTFPIEVEWSTFP